MRTRAIAGLVACTVALGLPPRAAVAGSEPATRPRSTAAPTKADAWIALARAHASGQRDRSLVDVAQWTADDLGKAVDGLRAWKRRVSPDVADDTLLRLAMLHTDLALLAPDLAQRFDGLPGWPTRYAVTTSDGQALGASAVSAHWQLARAILDEMPPRAQENPRVLEWYRAIGTLLLQQRALGIALLHLDAAERLFPADRDLNLLAGLLHESLARVAQWELPAGLQSALDPEAELRAARRSLARALEADPSHGVAQLHLARVCHLLGDDRAADAAATAVLSRSPDPELSYLGELVLGSIQQAARRFDEARANLERAAAAYPAAQSPLVALSQVARASGNRAEAVRSIERLAALSPAASRRDDPWWNYERGAVADGDAQVARLRSALQPRSRQ